MSNEASNLGGFVVRQHYFQQVWYTGTSDVGTLYPKFDPLAHGEVLNLPDPQRLGLLEQEDLRMLIDSSNDGPKTHIELQRLGDFLAYIGGVYAIRAEGDIGNAPVPLRGFCPSPGGLLTGEVIVSLPRGQGMASGTYWYDVAEHRLVGVIKSCEAQGSCRTFGADGTGSGFCIWICSNSARLSAKYGEFAARLECVYAGHIGEWASQVARHLGWTSQLRVVSGFGGSQHSEVLPGVRPILEMQLLDTGQFGSGQEVLEREQRSRTDEHPTSADLGLSLAGVNRRYSGDGPFGLVSRGPIERVYLDRMVRRIANLYSLDGELPRGWSMEELGVWLVAQHVRGMAPGLYRINLENNGSVRFVNSEGARVRDYIEDSNMQWGLSEVGAMWVVTVPVSRLAAELEEEAYVRINVSAGMIAQRICQGSADDGMYARPMMTLHPQSIAAAAGASDGTSMAVLYGILVGQGVQSLQYSRFSSGA